MNFQHYSANRAPRVIELNCNYNGNLSEIETNPNFDIDDLIVGDVIEAKNGFFVITNPETGEAAETERRLVDLAWNHGDPVDVPRIDDSVLEDIAEVCLDAYSDSREYIRSIFLYDGAAKNYLGYEFVAGDFDAQIMFDRDARITSTHGTPVVLGEVDGIHIEAMRNTVPAGTSIEEYANNMYSPRWKSIRSNPVVQIYPEIKMLRF